MRAIVPVGRVLFALIFVASVVGHFSSVEIAAASAHGCRSPRSSCRSPA
jgi:hypothetical protein